MLRIPAVVSYIEQGAVLVIGIVRQLLRPSYASVLGHFVSFWEGKDSVCLNRN